MSTSAEDSHALHIKRLAATNCGWLPDSYEDAISALDFLKGFVERNWPRERTSPVLVVGEGAQVVALKPILASGP
jgi:hypothetical protein